MLLKFSVADLAATAPNASAAAALAGQFRIECPNRVHVLRCDDVKQLPAWVAALSALARTNAAKRKDSIIRETVDAAANNANSTSVASHCASCKEAFGILRSKHVCAKCALVFCGSLSCFEAKSLHATTGRCCVSCAATRDANAPHPDTTTAKKGLVSSFMGALGAPFNPKLKPSNANLLIRVMAGRHLMVCDASGFSDPYCCIFFDGQEYRTEIEFQTLNPVWNAQFNIPITGLSKDIQIGVYDSDRYSNDDFMGMVQIPLSELENDKVFEDWFPLKGRPGKKADKSLAISGAIHLQLVVTESLFSLFAPIWEHQLPPEEKYSQVVLKHNIKRVTNLLEGLQIAWWQQHVEEVLHYKHPIQSILWLMLIQATVLFYPAEWILPAIPLGLLMILCANFISDQSRLIEELESRSVFSSALLQATDASGMKKASDAVQQAALMNVPEGGALVKSNSGNGSGGGSNAQNGAGSDHGHDSGGSNSTGPSGDPDDDEEDEEEEEEVDEKRMALGFLGKIRQYQKQLAKVQHMIGKVCDKLEAVQNLFRWHDSRRSKMVAIVLVAAFVFLLSQIHTQRTAEMRGVACAVARRLFLMSCCLFLILLCVCSAVCPPVVPFRILLFLGVTARWAKRLLTAMKKKRPKPKKPSEVENFLQRTQTSISLNPLKMHLVEKLRKS